MANKLARGSCIVGALLQAACASAPPPAAKPAKKPAPTAAAPELPAGSILRGDLEQVLRQGPPWVLNRVPIEEVLEKGKFIGWRVQQLPVEWEDVELRAGDVVTAVNTLPLETPTELWAAWTTLTVASEVKVAYLRDGEPRELSLAIYGAANPGVANELQKRPKPGDQVPQDSPVKANQRYNKSKQFKTITIKGQERYNTDTLVDWSD